MIWEKFLITKWKRLVECERYRLAIELRIKVHKHMMFIVDTGQGPQALLPSPKNSFFAHCVINKFRSVSEASLSSTHTQHSREKYSKYVFAHESQQKALLKQKAPVMYEAFISSCPSPPFRKISFYLAFHLRCFTANTGTKAINERCVYTFLLMFNSGDWKREPVCDDCMHKRVRINRKTTHAKGCQWRKKFPGGKWR